MKDSSLAMLRRARRAAPGAALVRADALTLLFPNGAFGAVVSVAALDLLPDAGAALLESSRVLCPRGGWLTSCFVRNERPLFSSVWPTLSAELGMHALTEQRLRDLSKRAGLTGFEHLAFGSYVLAWAKKGRTPSR